MKTEPVLSRHRLPRAYRWWLVALWLTPMILLTSALAVGHGLSLAFVDPRLLLMLAVMMIPALYVWHEGVDVLADGLITRVFWPRYYPYTQLETWYLDSRPNRRVLTIWDSADSRIFEAHAAHLTDLPRLIQALQANIRYRHWPR